MEQQVIAFSEDLNLLSDYLNDGVENKWTHELRKQILQLLHRLKTSSRKASNQEVEAELLAVETTLGFGLGKASFPERSLIEDHQLRLLELAELSTVFPELSPAVYDELLQDELGESIETSTSFENGTEQSVSNLIDETSTSLRLNNEFTEDNQAQEKLQLILCNCPGRDAARDLARGLVEKHLAACVNIIANIGAIYWWDGEIQDTAECQLQIKTKSERLADCLDFIKQNHPNTMPEILTIAVDDTNEDYFDWVKRETSDQ